MKTRLHITASYHPSLDPWKGKDVYLQDSLAREKKLNPGTHEAGIVWETEKAVKVRVRSEEYWLPKDAIRVTTVEKKGLFDF